MEDKEFFDKINAVQVEEPDEIDLLMLKNASKINDGTYVDLEEFKKSLIKGNDL